MNFVTKYLRCVFLALALFISILPLKAQNSKDTSYAKNDTSNKRLKILLLTEGSFFVTSYTAFYYLWYKDYKRTSFHFFNDGMEWRGMDKFGHSFSSYWLSNLNSKAFQWTGLNHKKSVLFGGISSFVFMTSIELQDGFSSEWGASLWDMAANTGGIVLFMAQELSFEKQVVLLKYSYYPSEYAKYRPNELGKNFPEKLIKDYNATKFWLSFDLNTLVSSKIPSWLNLAIGYGASGLTGGSENYYAFDCNCKPVPDSERMSEYYLSFDINLSKIKVKSRFGKSLLYVLNSIKFPAPALQYSKKGWQFLVR